MQETVVLLLLLVLGGCVVEEFLPRGGIGDGVGRAEQEQEGSDELGGPSQHRLLRRAALGVPARGGDLLIERIGASGVLDAHVAGKLLGLELVAHGQARQHARDQLPGEDLDGRDGELEAEVRRRQHRPANGIRVIEQIPDGDQRSVAVAEEEQRRAPGPLADAREEHVEIGEVLVESVYVRALATALTMAAAIEQVDRISPVRERMISLCRPRCSAYPCRRAT